MNPHDWLYEVFFDIAEYAKKNGLLAIREKIDAAYPVLVEELGPPPVRAQNVVPFSGASQKVRHRIWD